MSCPAENIDLVRLLITDIDGEIFTNQQVSDFLALYGDNPRRAAARALRTIAASEVLISKKITTQDLSTDGAVVSAELRALADDLDREADALEAEAGEDTYAAYIPGPGVGRRTEAEEWVY